MVGEDQQLLQEKGNGSKRSTCRVEVNAVVCTLKIRELISCS